MPPPSSVDALVTPGQSVALAYWASPVAAGGSGATIYGSRAPDQGDINLHQNVRARIQLKRGGVVRFEDAPWPSVGFVRRVIAEEVTVHAIGAPTFVGTGAPPPYQYRLGAAVQNGLLPDCPIIVLGAGSAWPGALRNTIIAPTGAREFRVLTKGDWNGDTVGAPLPPTLTQRTLTYANALPGGALYSSGETFDFGALIGWTPWPPWYSGLMLTASNTGQLAVEFTI